MYIIQEIATAMENRDIEHLQNLIDTMSDLLIDREEKSNLHTIIETAIVLIEESEAE